MRATDFVCMRKTNKWARWLRVAVCTVRDYERIFVFVYVCVPPAAVYLLQGLIF